MPTPTQSAQNWFRISKTNYQAAWEAAGKAGDSTAWNTAGANIALTDGLIDLATGLRATYQLLEEVKQLLQRPR
jgi:hypothetical protein